MQERPEQWEKLLEPADTAVVPAIAAPFVVNDQIKPGSGITFSTVWGEFRKRFSPKVEEPAAELRLQKYKLLRFAPDGPIIAELGGESRAECRLSAAFELMRRQARGEDGFLQTNGYANIFYVRDPRNELCAIRIGWDDEGWVIDAISVKDPLAWNGKHQIFCPAPQAGPIP